MSTFNETLHPRAASGEFTDKVNSAPAGQLDGAASDAAAAHADRIQTLEDRYFDLWSDERGYTALRQIGESNSLRAAVAETSTDPCVLATLARDTIGDTDQRVAQNRFATAPILHAIASDTSRDRAYEARFAAFTSRNCDEATIRELWSRKPADDPYANAIRIDLASAPNTPGDILAEMVDRGYSPIAGAHPHLPAETRDAAIADPHRAHLVIDNPNLTAQQLDAAARNAAPLAVSADEDDDDTIWAALTAAGVAKHPNVTEETVTALLTFPDAHVQKTARDRLAGNRITRARAAAEQEMRDAGGTDDEIKLAGDIAGRRALKGKEWGEA
ncbi:MAG: hypothetical protein J0J04_08540 [Microbacterium sp.]|uniref:hypothetical protein n=1 Tax=Microbacterium sp. TaxID=51671 RepID=UPI001AC0C2A1|nr:hypothetical protein [Microbacterium sp.]MBN9214824.1 hypothetical protein [Microbacterium sp.]